MMPVGHIPPPVPELPPAISAEDLSPEAQALLGTVCDFRACSCLVSPNVTCQVVDTAQQWLPAQIANARKGDLILCSDDGRGTIGTLLGALTAPQAFSHMGIMVDDYLTIRHSTMSDDRMTDADYASGPDIGGNRLPILGYDADVVRVGWPGTITQSVDEAFRAQNPGVIQNSQNMSSAYRCDRDNGTTPPETLTGQDESHCYPMAQLSFNTVIGQLGDFRPCLVVSPCTGGEQMFPLLRLLLHGVADEARAINGYYAFYAYTNAAIAQDPSYVNNGPMPVYGWNQGAVRWEQVEASAFDPASPCTPPPQQAPVRFTVPVVCSSLPWLAVQNFNARQSQYRIILSAGQAADRPVQGCAQVVGPDMAGLVQDPQFLTPDGLYYFTPQDRAAAASIFDASLQQTVLNTVALEWGKVVHVLEEIEGVAVPALAVLALVEGVLLTAGAVIAVVAELLNISQDTAAELVAVLTEMPAHIANQIVNTFAFNDPTDVGHSPWHSPGAGRAVGPEDIVWFWGATRQITPGPPTVVQGLYGQNQKLILRQPGWGTAPQCQWTFSPGLGTFKATAFLSTGGSPVPFTIIDVACHQGITNFEGVWESRLPAGTYWANAYFQDSGGVLWSTQETVEVIYGEITSHVFTLMPPPVDYREVICSFTAEAFPGSIWASGNPVDTGSSGPIYLGPRGDPADPDSAVGSSGSWDSGGLTYHHDHQVGVAFNATMSPGGMVSGDLNVYQKQGGQVHVHHDAPFGPISPGGQESLVFNISTGGVLPDKISGTVTIVNSQSYPPAA